MNVSEIEILEALEVAGDAGLTRVSDKYLAVEMETRGLVIVTRINFAQLLFKITDAGRVALNETKQEAIIEETIETHDKGLTEMNSPFSNQSSFSRMSTVVKELQNILNEDLSRRYDNRVEAEKYRTNLIAAGMRESAVEVSEIRGECSNDEILHYETPQWAVAVQGESLEQRAALRMLSGIQRLWSPR